LLPLLLFPLLPFQQTLLGTLLDALLYTFLQGFLAHRSLNVLRELGDHSFFLLGPDFVDNSARHPLVVTIDLDQVVHE